MKNRIMNKYGFTDEEERRIEAIADKIWAITGRRPDLQQAIAAMTNSSYNQKRCRKISRCLEIYCMFAKKNMIVNYIRGMIYRLHDWRIKHGLPFKQFFNPCRIGLHKWEVNQEAFRPSTLRREEVVIAWQQCEECGKSKLIHILR